MGCPPAWQPIKIDQDAFLKKQFVLPPLSATLVQVLQTIQSANSGAAEVAELVSRDPAMASHLLKVVNSAYYALAKPIANIQYAIAYLGLGEVSRICLTLSVIGNLKPKNNRHLEHFWQHSYLTALVAKRLVKELCKAGDTADLYASALLHDIGQLVYQRFFPDHYTALRQSCEQLGTFLVDAETRFELPSHIMFGSLLCQHWSLPQSIVRACQAHELTDLQKMLDDGDRQPLDMVIPIANMIATLARETLNPLLEEQVVAAVRRALSFSEDSFLAFLKDTYELKRRSEADIRNIM